MIVAAEMMPNAGSLNGAITVRVSPIAKYSAYAMKPVRATTTLFDPEPLS